MNYVLKKNKAILADIESKITIRPLIDAFLQSIPVERPTLEPSENIQTDVNNSNYQSVINKLTNHKQSSS